MFWAGCDALSCTVSGADRRDLAQFGPGQAQFGAIGAIGATLVFNFPHIYALSVPYLRQRLRKPL